TVGGARPSGSVSPDEELIRAALEAARDAGPRDVPIGAVIVAADGTELARAANMREELGDPRRGGRARGRLAAGRHDSGGDGRAVHDVCRRSGDGAGGAVGVRGVGTEDGGGRVAVGRGARPAADAPARGAWGSAGRRVRRTARSVLR